MATLNLSLRSSNRGRRRTLPPIPIGRASLRARRSADGEATEPRRRSPSFQADIARLQKLPPEILAQLKSVENDKAIIPGQGFDDIREPVLYSPRDKATTPRSKVSNPRLQIYIYRCVYKLTIDVCSAV